MRARYLLMWSLLTGGAAFGQRVNPDTVLKSSTIEVLQSYKPQIKEAPKPEWIPQLPPLDTSHPSFSYDVPQQTLFYTYSSQPLRPLALGREAVKLPFENYIKAGAGNLNTIYVDAGIGGIRGASYETDFHVHHLSQAGDIKFQQSSLSGLEGEWLQHGAKADWHTVVNGEYNQYYYYGFDHDLHPNYVSDSLKQTFTLLRLALDVKNHDSKAKFSYDPGIDASYYMAAHNTSEINARLSVPLEYKFDNSVQALLTLSGADGHFNSGDTTRDNTVAEVAPGLRVHTGALTGHATLGYAFGAGNNQYLLPDVEARVAIAGGKFAISAGYQSELRQNTYQQLSMENPYMFNAFRMVQTKSDELFGQLQFGIGDHLFFSGRVSWWSFSGLPEFLNDTLDHKQFYVVYDTVNALGIKLSARYKVGNKWSAGLTSDLYGYTSGKQQYVWHEPGTKIKGDVSVNVASKLMVSAYLAVLSGIYAKDADHKAVLLSPITDIGANAEYQLVKRLSAFVQVSNLLNNNYQRWYGYQAYGINIYGGLRLKF